MKIRKMAFLRCLVMRRRFYILIIKKKFILSTQIEYFLVVRLRQIHGGRMLPTIL